LAGGLPSFDGKLIDSDISAQRLTDLVNGLLIGPPAWKIDCLAAKIFGESVILSNVGPVVELSGRSPKAVNSGSYMGLPHGR
jgi:hypothetical protein